MVLLGSRADQPALVPPASAAEAAARFGAAHTTISAKSGFQLLECLSLVSSLVGKPPRQTAPMQSPLPHSTAGVAALGAAADFALASALSHVEQLSASPTLHAASGQSLPPQEEQVVGQDGARSGEQSTHTSHAASEALHPPSHRHAPSQPAPLPGRSTPAWPPHDALHRSPVAAPPHAAELQPVTPPEQPTQQERKPAAGVDGMPSVASNRLTRPTAASMHRAAAIAATHQPAADVLLYIDVKWDGADLGQLAVKEGVPAMVLARCFARKHGLQEDAVRRLASLITQRTAAVRGAPPRKRSHKRRGVTVPKPFNLRSGRRAAAPRSAAPEAPEPRRAVVRRGRKVRRRDAQVQRRAGPELPPFLVGKPVGSVHVNLGGGQDPAVLHLHLGDDANAVVSEFARIHMLPEVAVAKVRQEVAHRLQAATESALSEAASREAMTAEQLSISFEPVKQPDQGRDSRPGSTFAHVSSSRDGWLASVAGGPGHIRGQEREPPGAAQETAPAQSPASPRRSQLEGFVQSAQPPSSTVHSWPSATVPVSPPSAPSRKDGGFPTHPDHGGVPNALHSALLSMRRESDVVAQQPPARPHADASIGALAARPSAGQLATFVQMTPQQAAMSELLRRAGGRTWQVGDDDSDSSSTSSDESVSQMDRACFQPYFKRSLPAGRSSAPNSPQQLSHSSSEELLEGVAGQLSRGREPAPRSMPPPPPTGWTTDDASVSSMPHSRRASAASSISHARPAAVHRARRATPPRMEAGQTHGAVQQKKPPLGRRAGGAAEGQVRAPPPPPRRGGGEGPGGVDTPRDVKADHESEGKAPSPPSVGPSSRGSSGIPVPDLHAFHGASAEVDADQPSDFVVRSGGEGAVLFSLDIDIDEGRQGRIEVAEGDDLGELAQRFTQHHGLEADVSPMVTQLLQDHLSAHLNGV